MAPPKGKGKDLSRMSAPPAPPPTASVSAQGSSGQQSLSGSGAAAVRVPSPRSGKPKGKDFSRMAGPPSSSAVQQPPPATVAVGQPPPVVSQRPVMRLDQESMVRRQNAARVAAGMPPIANPAAASRQSSSSSADKPVVPSGRRPSGHQSMPPRESMPSRVAMPPSSYAQPQHQQVQVQAVVPNAAPVFTQQQQMALPTQTPKQPYQKQQQPLVFQPNVSSNVVIHPVTREVQQPTQRPSWSEARLSTMDSGGSKATNPSSPRKSQDGFGKPSLAPILGEKLQKLCHSIDPSYTLDSEVQERLVEMADSFVEKVTKDATKLARHRGSSCLDVVDVALALKKGYNMSVPGLGPPSVPGAGVGKGEQGMGGWLFADKVSLGGDEQPKKKRRTSGAAAATTAAM